ncbi:hypothetical protein [Bacillus sp. MUM 116]|nr:hypothetical protein [Bacillus sp. MUM 116]
METANLAVTINKEVFIQMSLLAVKSGMKKKEIVEHALIEYLKHHK